MKRMLFTIFSFPFRFYRIEKGLITILFKGYSGSNLSPILEYAQNLKGNNIKIIRVDKFWDKKKNKDFKSHFNRYCKYIKRKIIYLHYISKSELVISTHGSERLHNRNTFINLWHGIPIKGMSLMNKSQRDKTNHIKDDYLITTSNFHSTLMNSCIGVSVNKYEILGYPRNDYLFNENGLKNLEQLLKQRIKNKIIIYVPTYSETKNNGLNFDNLFGFSQFSIENFNDFLCENQIVLLLKLHPNEERKLLDNNNLQYSNIIILKEKLLEQNNMDLYKILNAVDLLITDFSSIYFDFLLLDRPLIFTPTNIAEYRKTRGFLLEPYDYWTPGPKCFTQKELETQIKLMLNNNMEFKKNRENIKQIMHEFYDGKSTKRFIEFIQKHLIK